MRVREYGTSGPLVVVLHGGPGAPGYLAPVARALGAAFRVLEPYQRSSGGEPLTVARHVADLHELITSRAERPALVGHSWGAMLALAYSARHPGNVAALALVGCGTFDRESRERLESIRRERTDDALRRRLERLPDEIPDPDERLRATARLTLGLYSHDLVEEGLEIDSCDARAFRESWQDMLRMQDEGVYPAAFAAIEAPVILLHGAVDPHPGRMIRATLVRHIRHLEYYEWANCGHYPWLEKSVRDEFFDVLRAWLTGRVDGDESGHRDSGGEIGRHDS
jgi:pimeloyl-ACP methyl ester carboxylesterase